MAGELIRPGDVTVSRQCSNCKREAVSGRAKCSTCADSDKRSKARPGICRRCSSPSTTPSCAACLKKMRDDYRRRVESGQCVYCQSRATAGAFCLRHWFKNIGSSHGLNRKNGGLGIIELLWEEQGHRCAVTGEELIPGHNASLDHIIPTSKGGKGTKDNLRWVLLSVNLAKSDLTHQQFVELCRKVVAHEDKPLSTSEEAGLRLVSGSR